MFPDRRNAARSLLPLALTVLLAACAAELSAQQPAPLRVLFIGNSLTFTNDLPSMVERLSRAAGVERPVDAEMIARGGDSFYLHTERRDDGAPLKVIARGGWDVVVLQENGRVAARGGIDSFPFASRLVRATREAGAKPIFYMTWAYRGQEENLPRIRDAYSKLGSRLEVEIAPVGEAWHLAREAGSAELFAEDGIHPGPEGSYLAACVIFSTLYQRSPEGLSPLTLEPETALRLQKFARRVTAPSPNR